MPTPREIESVFTQIERLQASRPEQTPWAGMTYSEKYVALEELEWAGFTRAEEMAVIARVLLGEAPELWMGRLDTGKPDRDDWMAKLSIDDQSRIELAADLDRIKRDTYVELEEQVAGWNFTRGEGGYAYHQLPVTDREVLVEDYVDWGKYMQRGLTFEDQARVMHHAAGDPYPREPLPTADISEPMNDGAAAPRVEEAAYGTAETSDKRPPAEARQRLPSPADLVERSGPTSPKLTGGLVLPGDVLARVEAAAAAAKAHVREPPVHVDAERSGQLIPPLTPRHQHHRPRL
jgi:hypothetical protein